MAGPCTGLTVLDLTYGMAGSLATLVLADYGAEVIKVEPPGGDPYRSYGAWLSWNRGKKSAVIDLKTTSGREQAIALAGKADVLVESFRPGDTAEMGIDYEALSKRYPGLVYCSITGFGQKGPLRRLKGNEGVVSARAGRMLYMEGQPLREGPVYAAVQVGSWHATMAAVRGILAALRVRDMCGRGQWVTTSILQGLTVHDYNSGVGSGVIQLQLQKMDPKRYPPPNPPGTHQFPSIGYIPVRTKDGKWLQHANQRVPHIQGHLRAIGLGHLLEDERFKNVPNISTANRELLRIEILNAQLTKTADEWMDIYIKDGNIAAEPYRTSLEGMRHPAVIENGIVAEVNDPRVGPMKQLALLTDLKSTPGEIGGPAPDLGQHTAEVLAHLDSKRRATAAKLGTGSGHMPPHPLEGVTILDLATVIAGPFGTALLADLGARVIKVDATDERVDEGRRSTAREITDPKTYAGKECIQVDLQTPEGKEVLHKLVAKADVLLHNFRVGVDKRLEADAATCLKINPRLVHVWMGTYGDKGPYAGRPGAHPIPGAVMGGPMRQMGRGMPPPPDAQLDMDELIEATRWIMRSNWGPDQNTSAAIATAIMLGLRARQQTGKGQAIHQTMLAANSWTNADEYYDYAGRPSIAVADDQVYGLNAIFRLYPALDGWVFLGIEFDDEWQAFCRAVDRQDLLTDPRFATKEARGAHDDDLAGELYGVFAAKSPTAWEELLTKVDVGCVRADEMIEGRFYMEHPHAKANAMTVEVEHRLMGKYLRHGGLVEFSLTPGLYRPSDQMGQQTEPILKELGYTDAQVHDLFKRQIVEGAELVTTNPAS